MVEEAQESNVTWFGVGGLGEECLIVDGEVGVGVFLWCVFPAMAVEVAGVGLVAVRTDGHLWGMGEGNDLFQPIHVGGNDGFLFFGEVQDRDQQEQCLHVDGAVFHITGVEVHQLEVGEGYAAAVKHVVLQGGVVVVGGTESERTLHLDGFPSVTVAHQQVDHHQGVVVLEDRLVHHVDGRVVEVFHRLFHPFGEL